MTMRPVAAILLTALLSACSQGDEAPEPIVRPVLVMDVAGVSGPSFDLPGTIEPRIQTALGFRVLGRITSRPVETGDTVAAGAVLATVDPTQLDLAVQAAEADLLSARAQLAEASGVAYRQSELLAARASTPASFESADQQRRTAQAQVTSAEARLSKAREQRNYAELKADYDGVVLATNAEVGQVVSPGQAVLTLARPDVREAVVDVPDQLASGLSVGDGFAALLELDHGLTARGTIREIAPSADPATRTRRVRIALTDPGPDFRLGSTVRVFPSAEGPARILVPQSAIGGSDSNTHVFTVGTDGHVALRPVTVAPAMAGLVEVTSGLADGDRIAVAGVNRLQDGQRVRVGEGEL